MADSLNFSLWFPTFHEEEMMPRAVSVMRQFLFSEVREEDHLFVGTSGGVVGADGTGTAI